MSSAVLFCVKLNATTAVQNRHLRVSVQINKDYGPKDAHLMVLLVHLTHKPSHHPVHIC
jgi:hypothetical protein